MEIGRKIGKFLTNLITMLVAVVVLFIFIEFSYRIAKVFSNLHSRTYTVKEQEWRTYDDLLGWKNRPDTHILVDRGHGGINITINSQGFRGENENIKSDAVRIIALGDSFTFGYGEDDDETYPYFLEQEFKAGPEDVEVINMGCTAYGIDQEYLWFKRDGLKIKPEIVVLGLLDINFSRATLSRWIQGENKPRFKMTRNGLKLTNVPVPKPSEAGRSRISNKDIFDILFNTQGSYFLSFIRDRLYRVNLRFISKMPEISESFRLGKEILKELKALCEKNGIELYVAIFPKKDWEEDLQPVYYSMKSLGKELDIEIIDMVKVFNTRGSWKDLYSSNGHFTPEGNKLVAEVIYERIKGDTKNQEK